MNKILKNILIFVAGIVFGYLIYYNVIMDVVAIMYGSSGIVYVAVSIALLLLSMLCSCMMINLLVNRKVDRWMLILITIFYFSILFFALFCRTAISREFIINPLDSIRELNSWRMLFQTVLNLLMFVPLGFYLRKIPSSKKVLAIAVCISFGIELIQGITQRGFFDTFDIILYCIGIMIGYKVSRKIDENFR